MTYEIVKGDSFPDLKIEEPPEHIVQEIKHIVKRKIDDRIVTISWLKFYEMAFETGLCHVENPKVFFVGELPGTGILAFHHLLTTLGKGKWEWRASSLMSGGGLDDILGFIKKHPHNWINGGGDITKLGLYDEYAEWANVYICDACDLVADEKKHLPILVGGIYYGLMVLKIKGLFIVRLCGVSLSQTKSLICGVAKVFDRTFLRQCSVGGGLYLVGVGYKGQKSWLMRELKSLYGIDCDDVDIEIDCSAEVIDVGKPLSINGWLATYPLIKCEKSKRLIVN